MTENTDDETAVDDPTTLRWVGPKTAEVIRGADFEASGIVDKSVTYRMLVDAGANPGVAAKIRREHSLSWSFDSGSDLDRRSAQVRGLQDGERAWVAASYGDDEETEADDGETTADDEEATADDDLADDWPTSDSEPTSSAPDEDPDLAAEAAWVEESTSGAETDGSGDPVAAESAWRERSKPTPLTELDEIDGADAEQLGEAGVTSVRSLATVDPELLADRLGLDPATVEAWHRAAREYPD